MFSSPAGSTTPFALLPTRPPTPPKDISKDVEDTIRFLEIGHLSPPARPKSSRLRPPQDTPSPNSPASSLSRGSTTAKKVGFSPFPPVVHSIPLLAQSDSPASRLRKPSSLRRELQPLKSILKQSNEQLPLTPEDLESKLSYFSPQEPGSFRRMLQSVLAQLASPARDDRRDAYTAITGALRAYEGVPEPQAICEKMTLLQQFISRDMSWKDSNGRLDTQIVTQALQLAIALLHNSKTEPAYDDDFRTLLLERSMMVLEQDDMQKGIYKLHMYLLSQQRFRQNIMTAARVDKLITILQGSEDRCSGNSVISARLIAYERLIQQAPLTMLNRMRDWIEYIFHGLLSSIPDIRTRALEACVTAGLTLGHHPPSAKMMYELAEKEGEDGQAYGDYLNQRMKEMTANRDTAKFVPQIWAAIILLLRCKRRPLEKWACFKDWLGTIQRCLNSPDIEVKHHAHIAWNKLVFTVMPDASTADSMRSMLRVPIMPGLDKRGLDRVSQQHRQIAMDSYCNLLHYGLRPGLAYEDVDKAWDLYVDPILTKMAKTDSTGQRNACDVLQGLLRKGNGIWNMKAANEPGTIKPADLPRLESRWVRSRLAKILGVLEPIIVAGMWLTPNANETANTCWQLLLQSISEAGSQEVKTSNELKDAMAQLTNFFRRIWRGDWASRNEVEAHVWLDRYHLLLESAVKCIGAGHFVEDILSKASANELEAAPTPSNRTSKHTLAAFPAFVFLFALHYQSPPPLRTSGLYETSAECLLNLLANGKGSVTGSLALLHRTLLFCAPPDDEFSGHLWNLIAAEAVEALHIEGTMSPQRDAHNMGHAHRSGINILMFGIRYADSNPTCTEKVVELYIAICRSAKHFAADAGIALAVMEPLAKSMMDDMDISTMGTVYGIVATLLENGVWPKSRQELDVARKVLGTIPLGPPRAAIFDPFEHVHSLLNGALLRGYKQLENHGQRQNDPLLRFLNSLAGFLWHCPQPIIISPLKKLQTGLALWIGDKQRRLFPLTKSESAHKAGVITSGAIASQIVDIWSTLLRIIDAFPKKDSALLQSLEPLFIAGLSSPSKEIVNMTIEFWNKTFGEQNTLEYPSGILPVLRARQAQTSLDLPDFPDDNSSEDIVSLPAFAESQTDASIVGETFDSAPQVTLRAAPTIGRKPPQENFWIQQHKAAHGLAQTSFTKNAKAAGSTASTPRTRLRHEDSQLDFAPIDSSLPTPMPTNESQALTEHQKEVKARQHGDAQMFPELSSSPAINSSSRARSIAKRLDFAPDSVHEQDAIMTTPTGLGDGNPMSDDLPSSPTPRAGNTGLGQDRTTQYSDDDEETVCDPPSSPPREDSDYPSRQSRHTIMDVEPTTTERDEQSPTDANAPTQGEVSTENCFAADSDLPSDTPLPTAQLQREAAAAAAPEIVEVTAPVIERITTLVQESQDKLHENDSRPSPLTSARIEDSMVNVGGEQFGTPAKSDEDTPRTRESNIRKRGLSSVTASRSKRTKLSPFKLWDRLRGNQDPDGEDIGDEIVVASSQLQDVDELAVETPMDVVSPQLDSQEKQNEPELPKDGPEVPLKRKRGRPRKSDSQRSSQAAAPPNPLKRSASALSTASTGSQPGTSVVGETPALSRTRKSTRLSQEASTTGDGLLKKFGKGLSSQVSPQIHASPQTRKSRRQSQAAEEPIVVEDADADEDPEQQSALEPSDLISRLPSIKKEPHLSPQVQISPHPSALVRPDEEEEDEEDEGPEHCLSQQSSSAPIPGRIIIQPKSILTRLRTVLADCKKMVFGSQEEEREFDDVLFEIRREVHEAGRRARDQGVE